jgi:hypothetical protein
MAAYEYGSAIKVTFDLPVFTSLPGALSTEEYIPAGGSAAALIASGFNSSYPTINAFDGSTSTYWRSSSTTAGQWIGKDFGRDVTLTKVIVRMDYSSGRINAYQLQGSADGTTWADVASGNFINASGDQIVTFSAATYRYWRLYATSKFSSYYTVSEMRFYGSRITYDTTGWIVTGYEPDKSPEGGLVPTTYSIRKITKVDDDYSVILWLDLRNRMEHPQGLVTVDFTGSLQGPGNAAVAPFTLTFTPSNIAPIFNPHDSERISLSVSVTATRMRIYYESYQSADENIEITPAITASLIHVNDLEQ